jgi:hypothetical protein
MLKNVLLLELVARIAVFNFLDLELLANVG